MMTISSSRVDNPPLNSAVAVPTTCQPSTAYPFSASSNCSGLNFPENRRSNAELVLANC
jgi:hypothetical protein